MYASPEIIVLIFSYGLWTVDYGLWTVDYGLWTTCPEQSQGMDCRQSVFIIIRVSNLLRAEGCLCERAVIVISEDFV